MKNDFDKCRLEERNNRIIDAVIAKAERVCPGSLAMIGIYGSFMTGDIHEKSDLDLLILVNDDARFQLSSGFIQDDLGVGHDIYCTTWQNLEESIQYDYPQISKLMDSEIVWCADETYRERLNSLRKSVREQLESPSYANALARAEEHLRQAEHNFAESLTASSLSAARVCAAHMIWHIQGTLAALNRTYFRLGTRRAYEELSAMEKRPEPLCDLIGAVVSADTEECLHNALIHLLRETTTTVKTASREFHTVPKQPVTPETIGGTYEEMFSNWRNKMYFAAETGDRYLAFMSMSAMSGMLSSLCAAYDTAGSYDAMAGYDPDDLWKTAEFFDRTMDAYLAEYKKAGLDVKRYADIDEFVENYLK